MDNANSSGTERRARELHDQLACGWNTWDVRSVLSHVLLPAGLSIRLGIKDYGSGAFLAETLVGRPGEGVECVRPGVRSIDGSYTQIEVDWQGHCLVMESATVGAGLALRVARRPSAISAKEASLIVSAGFLWNSPGTVRLLDQALLCESDDCGKVIVECSGERRPDRNVPLACPYQAIAIGTSPIVITAGVSLSSSQVDELMLSRRATLLQQLGNDESGEIRTAIQTCMAWDTIYDPDRRRVISPVSRVWSCGQGGWVLFCWDTYFAAVLASAVGARDLAYANLIEISRHATPDGFVPNTTNGHGFVTLDRSQPPVGATSLLQVYNRWQDKWVVEELIDPLIRWNRWWHARRRNGDCLSWGSNAYEPVVGNEWETPENGVGGRFGAALESGMDNSPVYDDIPFDGARQTLMLQDVGLTSLYLADCQALIQLACVIHRTDLVEELRERIAVYSRGLAGLWCEELSMFANRRSDTMQWQHRVSPMHLLPLLTGVPTSEQTERLLKKLFDSPTKLGGEWMLPSICRDDPAYVDQHYWRGRIWAPLNYLAWTALRTAGQTSRANRLAQSSAALLLKEWRSHRHVHENYHADTGDGCGYRWSDAFYHWGGLLGLPILDSLQPPP
jgi:putative isomerase